MRVLLICDDYYHPGNIPAEGAASLEKHGFRFDTVNAAENLNYEKMKEYPVILLCKSEQVTQDENSSWKTAAIQQAFTDYVENGGGLLAVHSALVAGKQTEQLDRLLGSRFYFHPAACPVLVQPIKPHPVTEGAGQFLETDEHYRLEILDENIEIFMASYSNAQGSPEKYESDPFNNAEAWISPAGYVRKQGKGRICVLTPGHFLPVWLNNEFQRILENALHWCAG